MRNANLVHWLFWIAMAFSISFMKISCSDSQEEQGFDYSDQEAADYEDELGEGDANPGDVNPEVMADSEVAADGEVSVGLDQEVGDFSAEVTDGIPEPAVDESLGSEPVAEIGSSPGGEFSYKIVKGDWLSKIAGRVYGDIYKWPLIANANPQIQNPHLIYPDDVIKVPIIDDQSQSFANTYSLSSVIKAKKTEANRTVLKLKQAAPSKTVLVVKKGDTLSKIAKRVLGSAKEWKSIWTLNKGIVPNPDMLQVGTSLQLADLIVAN